MFLETPAPHEEAAKRIRDKSPVTRAQFDRLLPELKDAAFLITGVTCFDVLQRVQDLVAQLPEGGKFRALQQQIEDELEPYLGEGAPAQRRAELLLRVHGFRAYAATNYRLMQAHKGAFPFRQYITSGDDRVRSSHAALRGKIFPADSPFWDNHTPPWGWGCRCEAIPLMQEEVDEMREEDARLPPESRRVVEGSNLQRAEELGQLLVNNGVVVNLQTPRERTGNPSAFEWRPGEYALPMHKIRERYEPQVFNEWRKWAQSTTLPDGKRTVWQAFNIKRSSAPPESPPVQPDRVPAPEPKPAAPGIPHPASSEPAVQVGAHVPVVPAAGMVPKTAKRVAEAIAAVHSDGGMRQSPLTQKSMSNAWGMYRRSSDHARLAADPLDWDSSVQLHPLGPTPLLTLTHEYGHKIDHEAILENGVVRHAAAFEVRKEILEAIRRTARAADIGSMTSGAHLAYLTSDVEYIARSYAQYIALRSGDPGLAADVESIRADSATRRLNVWEDADFEPVAKLYDKLMVTLGWAVHP